MKATQTELEAALYAYALGAGEIQLYSDREGGAFFIPNTEGEGIRLLEYRPDGKLERIITNSTEVADYLRIYFGYTYTSPNDETIIQLQRALASLVPQHPLVASTPNILRNA